MGFYHSCGSGPGRAPVQSVAAHVGLSWRELWRRRPHRQQMGRHADARRLLPCIPGAIRTTAFRLPPWAKRSCGYCSGSRWQTVCWMLTRPCMNRGREKANSPIPTSTSTKATISVSPGGTSLARNTAAPIRAAFLWKSAATMLRAARARLRRRPTGCVRPGRTGPATPSTISTPTCRPARRSTTAAPASGAWGRR